MNAVKFLHINLNIKSNILNTVKTWYKNLGFFMLASIGSYVNDIYCEIGLHFFFFQKTTTCIYGVAPDSGGEVCVS